MIEFKINEFITVKLENGNTNIYIKNQLFMQCKYILLNRSFSEIENLSKMKSVDELFENELEEEKMRKIATNIPLKTLFWAHCSNLQMWAESNYKTTLLHRNIAFPLLKKLVDIGDITARKTFIEEIINRFESEYPPVKRFLIEELYIKKYAKKELVDYLLDSDTIAAINRIKERLVKDYEITYEMSWQEQFQKSQYRIELDKGRVKALDLRNNTIKELPDSIFCLENLEKLYLQDLIMKVHDDALIKLWKVPFQKVSERIRVLLREQKRKEAIQEGKLFLLQFEGYPYISQLNIWKDNLFSLLQNPIIRYWTEQYEDIRSRSTISQKAYNKVISQWEDFLTNTEEDKDITAIKQLRSRARGRITTFKDKWARQDAIDAYFDLISLAEECYDIKDYEGAIVCMRNAIEVKKKDEKERMIFLKDTRIHVNNAEFIYFCGDKINEREIEKLLHEAKRCFRLHDDKEARHKLHEAQDLHAKFSNLYKDKERGKYRELIAQIRSAINQPIPSYS